MLRHHHWQAANGRLCKQDFWHRADDKQGNFLFLINSEEAFYNGLPEEMQNKLADELMSYSLTFAPLLHEVKKC